MRPLRLLTIAWGERSVALLEKASLRSLLQLGNLPAILKTGRRVDHLFVCPPEAQFQPPKLKGYSFRYAWFGDDSLKMGYLEAMKLCLADSALLMPALPDWFFANDSCKRIVDYVADRDMVVAGMYARVRDKEFLDFLEGRSLVSPIDSNFLVDLAFKYPHYCLEYADVTKSINHARWGGIFIQPLVPGLWSMSCRVPNIFLASINQRDFEEFRDSEHGYSHWDWQWPCSLMEQGRFRFLGSSDQFFMVDLTEPEKNHPKMEDNDLLNDEFSNDGRLNSNKIQLQAVACRMFVGSLRGMECV